MLLLDSNFTLPVTIVAAGVPSFFGGMWLLYNGIVKSQKETRSELLVAIEKIHQDIEPIKIKVALHEQKLEEHDNKITTIYDRQVHDNRDIQSLQVNIAKLARS